MSFLTLKNCWKNHFEKVAEDDVDDIYSHEVGRTLSCWLRRDRHVGK